MNCCIGTICNKIVEEARNKILYWANDDNNPWISVDDKMPNENDVVLGKANTQEREGVYHKMIILDGRFFSLNLGLPMGSICYKVTHWKPVLNKIEDESDNIFKQNIYVPWISVNETLPERPRFDWVLVRIVYEDGNTGVPRVAELRNGEWYSIESDLPMESTLGLKVTHWKPIPDEEIK